MKADLLAGYTVVLNAHYIPGPVAAWFLKSLGARVIKIEPLTGDMMRSVPPFYESHRSDGEKMGAFFSSLNAGFESIALNLKEPSGGEIFAKLLETAHVYIDGNRPGFLERILGKEASRINPDLATVPITAYGQDGPYTKMAGHDGNCTAVAGTMSYNGTAASGAPAMMGTQVADITAGLIAALTSLAMLVGKKNPESHAAPKRFDCAMLDAAMLFNQIYIAKLGADSENMVGDREWLNGGRGYYRIYRTRDGKAVFFGAIEGKLFRNFTERAGRKDLIEIRERAASDPGLLTGAMEELFLSRTLSQWQTLLKDCDCCFTPVNTIGDALDDPQVRHRNLTGVIQDATFGPMQRMAYPGLLDGRNIADAGPAPQLGRHTAAILEELHFTGERIASFYRDGVVG